MSKIDAAHEASSIEIFPAGRGKFDWSKQGWYSW